MSNLALNLSNNLNKQALYSHFDEPAIGDLVENVNPGCKHYKSKGEVVGKKNLPSDGGTIIMYIVDNSNGKTYEPGRVLEKTLDQLQKIG